MPETAAPKQAKAKKQIPPQVDVRIVGGKTTIELRAYGVHTCVRMSALLAELNQNAKTHAAVHDATAKTAAGFTELLSAINGPLTEAGDEEAE
jgi:hypothetical protein